MSLFKNIFNLACLFVASLWTLFVAIMAAICFQFSRSLGQIFHHAFGKGGLALMGIKVRKIGLENIPRSGCIWAPNHESLFDILLLSSLPYDFAWISKEQVGKIPFIGTAMRGMGCYFVKRNRSAHDLNIMSEVEEGLKKGAMVVIFPEGTRTRTGELLPFKKGAFKTAKNSGVPLIPMAITGTRAIAPPGKLPSFGHNITLRVGTPFYIAPDEDLNLAMGRYRQTLSQLLSEDRT